jgi:hypothetical protein
VISTPRRRARALPVVAVLLVALGWASTGIARADVSSFALSPTSGPPGTVVTASGTGCSPGSTVSASSDYVAVAAPTLQLYDKQIRVRKDGTWHGTFKVPSDANAGLAAAVAALCVSDTLPSLTTWYVPQTFRVTAPPTTTTTAPGGTTPTTPTTKKPTGTTPPTQDEGPGPDGGAGPGSTVPVFGGIPPDTSGGNTGGGTARGGSDGGGSATTKPGTTRAGLNRATRGMPAARAADLSVPRLPGAHVAGAGGLGWIAWLLLALVIAALGAPFWLRRSRRSDEDDGAVVVETR